MLLPGHLALGYLLTYLLLKVINPGFNAQDTNFILILGTICGAVVDFDFFSYFIKHKTLRLKKDVSHRDQFTHAPILWLIIGLVVFFFGGDLFSKVIGLTIWISAWGHFIFDSFEHGIMWIYPFSKKRFHIFKNVEHNINRNEQFLEHYRKFYFEVYTRTKTFIIELVVILIFLFVYFFDWLL